MKIAVAAAAIAVILPGWAFAQAKPLIQPADANQDGVVSEDERLDYLAKKAAGAQDQPGLPVDAPKAGVKRAATTETPGVRQTYETGAAGEHPTGASDFEKATEDRIRNAAKRD